jgi:protein disulfide-isomerase A1
LAPKYDQLGRAYGVHSDKVVIAKCDATLNDVPDDIRGFPTIKMYPAGKKDSPVEYTGDRSIEDLITFVREHGTHGVEVSVVEPLQEQDSAEPTAEEEHGHDEL